MATLGLRELRVDLDGGRGLPTTVAELADVGVARSTPGRERDRELLCSVLTDHRTMAHLIEATTEIYPIYGTSPGAQRPGGDSRRHASRLG